MAVLAADHWPTNAELIRAVRDLHFPQHDLNVLDATYGNGIWWKQLDPVAWGWTTTANQNTWDFRDLPLAARFFDVVFFDPPYVAKGGRATSGIREMDDRYGQFDCPATPQELQTLIDQGLSEMRRVVKKNGLILVKCQNYVSSGRLWTGAMRTYNTACIELGMECVDIFQHVSGAGPQPGGRRQVHARNNYSTLYVFRKRA